MSRKSFPFLLVLLTLAAPACRRNKNAAADAQPAAIHVGAEDIVVVKQEMVVSGPTLSGTLAARDSADVRAQVAGTVLEVHGDEGEPVTKGRLLARIDPGALNANAQSAQSAVTNAQAALATAEKEQARQEALFRSGIVAKRDVEVARQATSNARAQLAQARSGVTSAGVQLNRTEVTAPVAGTISAREVDAGDVVNIGSTLFSIVDLTTLQLEASVPSEQLAAVHVGLPVEFTVTGIPNKTFRGTITRIDPEVDPTTKQIKVFAEIPNNDRSLVAGLFAEGRIQTVRRTSIAVPTAAIDRRMTTPAVVRVRDKRVERVTVTLGLADERNDRIEIASGVTPGDVLLLGASQQLAPGTLVDLDMTPRTPPAAEPAQ